MKDFLSVKNDGGTRSHIQKRLLLYSLNESHTQFTSEHEGLNISISEFTKLRPRHCVLPRSSGSHNLCVCMHHGNVKLMLNVTDIRHLTQDTDMILKIYHDRLNVIVCPDPLSSYHSGECKNWSNTANFKDNMAKAFDKHSINEVRFKIWLQIDRCNLETLMMDTDEFLDDFCKGLLQLKTHRFI